MRYIVHFEKGGQIYYYFRRKKLPVIRLRGEPGSLEFMAIYNAALECKNEEAIMELRQRIGMQGHERPHGLKTQKEREAAEKTLAWVREELAKTHKEGGQ